MNFPKTVISIALSAILLGCNNQTPEEHIKEAQELASKGELEKAVIELKNAIKKDPNNFVSRATLGHTYMDLGKTLLAQKEYSKAIQNGGNMEALLFPYAYALYLNGNFDELLNYDIASNLSKEVLANINSLKSLTLIKLGQTKQAQELYELASKYFPMSEVVQFNSLLLNNSYKIDDVLPLLDSFINSKPSFKEPILYKALLLRENGKVNQAIDSYRAYLQELPNDNKARLYLAEAYSAAGQYEQAINQAEHVQKRFKQSPLANAILSNAQFNLKNYNQALVNANTAIQNGLDNTRTRVIAGISAYSLENYEQAYLHLIKIEPELPDGHQIKRLVAVLQLELNKASLAANTLSQIEGLSSNDLAIVKKTAMSLINEQKFGEARELTSLVESSQVSDPKSLFQLGIMKYNLGQKEGINDIYRALEINPDFSPAQIAIIEYLVTEGQFQKALDKASSWKQDDEVVGSILTAKIYMTMNNYEGAEKEYRSVLDIDPENVDANLFFAQKLANETKFSESKALIYKLLEKAPSNERLLGKLYSVSKVEGNTSPAIEFIKTTIEQNEDSFPLKLMLARIYILEKMPREVINLLKDIPNKNQLKNNSFYWNALIDSYTYLNNYVDATKALEQWLEYDSINLKAWFKLINIQEKQGDLNSALKSVNSAIKEHPNSEEALLIKIHLLIKDERFLEAKEFLVSRLSSQKDSVLYKHLMATIDFNSENYKSALPNLLASHNYKENNEVIRKIYYSYLKLGQPHEATSFLKSTLTLYPDSLAGNLLLATELINKSPLQSIQLFNKFLTLKPSHYLARNNLAWLYLKTNKLKEAKQNIELALKLAPNNPQILDTAAQIFAADKDIEKAKEYIIKAKTLAPSNKSIHKNYDNIMNLSSSS